MIDDNIDRKRTADLERLTAADRIAELERGIAKLENQEAPLTPLGLSVLEARRAELARLRNEQPTMIDHVRAARDDRHGRELVAALRDHNAAVVNLRDSAADEIERLLPSPATSPGPQDVRERIARALYEQERKRGERCNAVLTAALRKPIGGCAIEPWEECAETFLSDADAVLAALAQSDAQSVGDVRPAYVEHREGSYHVCIETPAQVCDFEMGPKHFADALAHAIHEHIKLYTTPPALPEGARNDPPTPARNSCNGDPNHCHLRRGTPAQCHRQERAMSRWRSIKTAPRDGTYIILTDYEHVEQDRWVHWGGGGESWDSFRYLKPKLWIPLPEPPRKRTAPRSDKGGA